MPAQESVPRRMTRQTSENGYGSPASNGHDATCFGTGGNTYGRDRRRIRCNNNGEGSEGSATKIIPKDHSDKGKEDGVAAAQKVGLRSRIGCFTWTWFTMTMATGGIANVLHSIPYRSEWLRIIGVTFFLFNMFLFLANCCLITLRFKWNPGAFKASFTSPAESLFIPACVVSVGTILINMSQYGIPGTGEWFQTFIHISFWLYAATSFVTSSGIYLILWSTQTFSIDTMTPIWIFPAYPLLLSAPFAANLIDAMPDAAAAARINSVAIAFGAICIQGTGFLVSLMIYSAFIYRLMTENLPRVSNRPGMFVSVGPSGFTVAGLVHLGNDVFPKIFPNGYMGNLNAAFFFKIISDIAGLWMWGLCLWFFIVSIGAHWQVIQSSQPKHHLRFDMTWYSFVFPNTALVTATQAIGRSFDSDAIKIFGTVLGVLLVGMWMFVFGMMIRSVWTRKLLWPEEIDEPKMSRKKWLRRERGQRR